MTDGRELLEAHLNGDALSDEQCDALSAWVCVSPENARLAAELTHLSETIAQQIKADTLSPLLDSQESGLFLEAIQEAGEGETHGKALDQDELSPIHISSSSPLTKKQVLSAMTYLYEHTVTPKRVAIVASAAALLLGVALAIALLGGPDDTPPIAEVPDATDATPDSPPPTLPIVATLTAEHDAVWDRRPGQDLYAGHRFTLTEGFAEITTHDGAIAIIEAPATIELIDSPNALRLHSGKLVGVCETDSSKGFVVRTPHIDVTDLGTRFGVDTTDPLATTVCVFEGVVQVTSRNTTPSQQAPYRLYPGQALSSNASGLVDTRFELAPFSFGLPTHDRAWQFEGDAVLWRGAVRDDMRPHAHEADVLQVYAEHTSLRLSADVAVDLLPGESWPIDRQAGQRVVAAGQAVDVYLLNLDPVGDQSSRDADAGDVYAKTVIRFDRPVLGLIGANQTLQSANKQLGREGVQYSESVQNPNGGAGPGLDTKAFADHVSLSPDGLTLTLDIYASSGIDRMRVLVNSQATAERRPPNP